MSQKIGATFRIQYATEQGQNLSLPSSFTTTTTGNRIFGAGFSPYASATLVEFESGFYTPRTSIPPEQDTGESFAFTARVHHEVQVRMQYSQGFRTGLAYRQLCSASLKFNAVSDWWEEYIA